MESSIEVFSQVSGRLGCLLATGRRALNHEVIALQSKVRVEKEVGTLRDAETVTQEVITIQAEWFYEQQCTVEQLVVCIAKKQRQRYGKSKVSISQVCALTMKSSCGPKEWDGNIWSGSLNSEIKFEPDLSHKKVVEA